MISVSEYFQKRREELGLTIPQISHSLNIRPEYLEAIEKENDKIFVSDVYRKGFVKLYAKYLGLNEEYALALDRRTHKIDTNKGVINLDEKHKNFPTNVKISIFFIFLTLFLVGIFGLFYIQAQRYNERPTLYLKQPINQTFESNEDKEITVNYTSALDNINILGTIDPDSKVYINDRLQGVDNLGEFSITKKVIFPGLNRFVFKIENKIGKKTVVNLNVYYNEPK